MIRVELETIIFVSICGKRKLTFLGKVAVSFHQALVLIESPANKETTLVQS